MNERRREARPFCVDDMEEMGILTIRNELGLHARAAARIVALGDQFHSRLYFVRNNQEVDGASILSILSLACPKGSKLQAKIVGKDSKQFMRALTRLFEERFGETS
jgi:phosphocarrier protein